MAAVGLFAVLPDGEEPSGGVATSIARDDRSTKWETSTSAPGDAEVERTLNAFLVEHGEFNPMSGMNGLMAYAKFVSYDAGE